MVALAAGAIGFAACSSGTGTPADAGTGGHGGAAGATSGTGGHATGGAPADGGLDTPASDAPVTDSSMPDTSLPCILDGGDASGDCCPDDPSKTQPGMCGCGVPDIDSDGDGVADCIDLCPGDSLKIAPGSCGCNVPDTDTDHDGTPDCVDLCPKDPGRITPGPCGCGTPDTTPLCLVHRYQFNDGTPSDGGTSDASADGGATDAGADGGLVGTTTVRDSVGTADGTAVRATLNGSGSLTLTGGNPNGATDQYVQLPAGIISKLGNSATFEAWVNWTGTGGFWQRIFDFGGNDQAPGLKGIGNSFIFATPQGTATGVLFVSYITVGNPVNEVTAPAVMPSGVMEHVAVVVDSAPAGDAAAPSVTLYLNGQFVMSTPLTNQLSQLNDVNNWLGRSQFTPDPSFSGTYYEFRIYSAARSAAQIAASAAAGPDTLPAN